LDRKQGTVSLRAAFRSVDEFDRHEAAQYSDCDETFLEKPAKAVAPPLVAGP